jgi:hypothetical protein
MDSPPLSTLKVTSLKLPPGGTCLRHHAKPNPFKDAAGNPWVSLKWFGSPFSIYLAFPLTFRFIKLAAKNLSSRLSYLAASSAHCFARRNT